MKGAMANKRKKKPSKRKHVNKPKPAPIDHDNAIKAIKALKSKQERDLLQKEKHDAKDKGSEDDETSSTSSQSQLTPTEDTGLLKTHSHVDDQVHNVSDKQCSSLGQVIDCQIEQMEKMQQVESDNPPLMQVTTVLQMFRDLKQEIVKAGLLATQSKEEEEKQDLNAVVKDALKAETGEIDTFKHKAAVNAVKVGAITDICDKMSVQINDLDQRIENLELGNSKRMVIITGLKSVEKKYMFEYLHGFFNDILETSVTVDDFFFVGSSEPRAIVVSFASASEKRKVMRVKSMLKDVQDTKIFINNYTPAAVQDRKRHERDVAEIGKDVFGEEKVTYTRAGLTINGKPYRKLVSPPTPREQIEIEPERMEKLLRKSMQRGDEITKEFSTFVGYTASVKTHQDVRDLYIKMKAIHPGARHIVCSYWVDYELQYQALDYHDDEEAGAGRYLMDLLKVNEMRNRVIFVARRYGGVKLGGERFQCYIDAAVSAITKDSFNTVLKVEQPVKFTNPRRAKTGQKRVQYRKEDHNVQQTNSGYAANQLNAWTGNREYRGQRNAPYRGRAARGQGQQLRGTVRTTQNSYRNFMQLGELVPSQPPDYRFKFSKPKVPNFDYIDNNEMDVM